MPAVLGFHALDVGEVEAFVVQCDVRTVLWILSSRLSQLLAEDLRTYVGYFTLRRFGLGLVHAPQAIVRCA